MTNPKTARNKKSVRKFIASVDDVGRREDAEAVLELLEDVTGEKPEMWGDSIVGFGSYNYKYASGREGEWPLTGFSPRKSNLTLYIMAGFTQYEDLLAKLGKHRTGKSCLYVKRLEDIDLKVLRRLVEQSVAHLRKQNASEENRP